MTPAEPPERPAGSGSGDDPFSWLYQRGHTAPTEDVPPAVPPTVEAPGPVKPQPYQAPPSPPTQPVPPPPAEPVGPPPTYVLPAYQPGTRPQLQPQPEDAPAESAKRRGPVVAIVVGALLVAVLAGVVVAVLVGRPDRVTSTDPVTTSPSPAPAPTTTKAPTTTQQPTSTQEPTSSKAAVKPVASGVSADCTAPPATDDAGQPVSYDAGNVLDGDRNTAWRCDGNGDSRTLTFTFPAGTTISTVGLVNGYAKTDPKSGAKRYGEYRRLNRVRWTFEDGTTVSQQLTDGSLKLQTTRVGPIETQRVTLTIDKSTKPGRSAKSRDAVLISEVGFG